MVPFYDEHGIRLSRILDHSRTKAKSPQTNGICERFHRTVLDQFYRIAFRKKIYRTLDELQADLDAWLVDSNEVRSHQGRWCFGKTPMQTFLDALPLAKEKLIAARPLSTDTSAQTANTVCQIKSQPIQIKGVWPRRPRLAPSPVRSPRI